MTRVEVGETLLGSHPSAIPSTPLLFTFSTVLRHLVRILILLRGNEPTSLPSLYLVCEALSVLSRWISQSRSHAHYRHFLNPSKQSTPPLVMVLISRHESSLIPLRTRQLKHSALNLYPLKSLCAQGRCVRLSTVMEALVALSVIQAARLKVKSSPRILCHDESLSTRFASELFLCCPCYSRPSAQ